MKVIVKILVLVIAISLAIGGVMVYAKTRVAPPSPTKSTDQFSKNLEESVASFNEARTKEQEDSLFTALTEKTKFFVTEGKVDKAVGNTSLNKLCVRYVPLFLNRSMQKFTQSVWFDEDHKYMLGVVAQLRSIKNFDNSRVLHQQSMDSLALVERIISNYRQARIVSRSTGFSSVNNAQATINKARAFAQDPYLKNCTSLVNALNGVRSAIAASHYRYLCASVESLSKYEHYTRDQFDDKVNQVDTKIKEYNKCASRLYGSKRNTDELYGKARGYADLAYTYYGNND